MTDVWNSACIQVGDTLLGWILSYPRDLAVVLLGIMLTCLLLVVRRATIDQAHWRQIAADERRLKELLRGARAAHDYERLGRHRSVRRLVAAQRARAEWVSVVASVLILMAILPWCRRRFEYIPLREGDDVRLIVRLPFTAAGEIAHVVPQSGVSALSGWVRTLEFGNQAGRAAGTAEWSLHVAGDQVRRLIAIRVRDKTAVHSVVVGGATYEPPVQSQAGGIETEVRLRAYQPFGLLPAQVCPGLPGWALLLTLVTGSLVLGARLPWLNSRNGRDPGATFGTPPVA